MGEELLQNDRIRLRPLEPEDLSVLYTLENDTAQWHVGCQNVPYSRFMLHQYIAENKGDIFVDKELRMVVASCVDGDVLGLVDLFDFDPMHHRAQVGIVVRKDYRHRGVAHQALELLKGYARFLQIHQLYAYVSCRNTASLQLFRGVGFSTETPLRDWLCTSEGYEDALLMQFFV